MRIALVTSSFLPIIGGAEMVVHHLGTQWCLQGHEVCVINSISDKATHPQARYAVWKYNILKGSSYILGPHRFPFRWYAARKLNGLLKEFNPDFISAHFGYPVGIWLGKIKPVPRFLITCHGPAVHKIEGGPRIRYKLDDIMVDSMNKSSGAVAISSFAHREMEKMGVEASKIIDIPNGVDWERFRKPASLDLRANFGMPKNALVVISVGRESRAGAKAYDVGIKAFANLARKIPEAYYVILGAGTNKWIPLTKKLNIQNRVFFSSGLYEDALVGAYQQADIYFSPSSWELCPLSVLEGMAAGLPAVVTNVSGSQDMISNGINGFVVEPGQPEEMAEALLQLANDESLVHLFRLNNVEISKSYDWAIISRKYLAHA